MNTSEHDIDSSGDHAPDPLVLRYERIKSEVEELFRQNRRTDLHPKIITPLPGPNVQNLLARAKKWVINSHTAPYPLTGLRGDGCFLWDHDNNCFLDFCAGIAVNSLGHNHTTFNIKTDEQKRRIAHISQADACHEPYVDICETLAKVAPGHSPKKVFLCNSGAEAVEAGIKLARFVTRRDKFIGFENAFHGRTFAGLSFTSSNAVQRRGFGRQLLDVARIPYPDSFRHDHKKMSAILDDFESRFTTDLPPEEIAAVLFEPIQGEGGYHVPPSWFVQRLRHICNEHAILLIADEVQSGNGRTGTYFCMEQHNVEPDILVTAKGIANGIPLGAMIATSTLADKWEKGSHTSTFGGNPIACAGALVVYDQLKNGVLENCAHMGKYFFDKLRALKEKHPMIGSVRGKGLMLAIELVKPWTKTPEPKMRDLIVQRAFENGLILLGCGSSAIRITPPLIINKREADLGLDILDRIITKYPAMP